MTAATIPQTRPAKQMGPIRYHHLLLNHLYKISVGTGLKIELPCMFYQVTILRDNA